MRKQKKKKSKLKIILIIVFLLLTLNCIRNNKKSLEIFFHNISNSSDYKVIKQDLNNNYSGAGQKKVSDKDGYFTTFTTTDNKKFIEYKQNGNSPWSQNLYWGGTMEENGCGITSMAIILSGYDKSYTPEYLRKKYYPKLNYENLSKELKNTFGIENSDFYYDSVHCSEKNISEHLESGNPILVCVWDNGLKNRWTEKSHYIVLLASDGNGMVYVSNPNGGKNDSKSSGWYDFDEVVPYIAKALYIKE